MIDFNTIMEEYAEEVGVTLHKEEGDTFDFYRDVNLIVEPVCGRWHLDPFPLTAVKRPFCGIATIDITVAAHPDNWQEVCQKMNAFAQNHNGTSRDMKDDTTYYSVSYNCQTCGVVSRIRDVNTGVGEIFEINQQLSFIIIESGVSAYDTFLYIDGIQIPYLSLIESKTHMTSNIPSSNGVVETMSEVEAYGIDFVVPYMQDDAGEMFRDIIDRATGNEAHCVVIDVCGKKSCHIMQFTQATSNVQPPQNIGINVSMVELNPKIASYNSMWLEEETEDSVAKLYVGELIQVESGSGCTVFWGDGSSEHVKREDAQEVLLHLYTDGSPSHRILVCVHPNHYYLPIMKNQKYYGEWLYFILPSRKIASKDFRKVDREERVFFSDGNDGSVVLLADEDRICNFVFANYTFLDKLGEDGQYYIHNKTKFQCFAEEKLKDVDDGKYICTSVWDGNIGSVGGYLG